MSRKKLVKFCNLKNSPDLKINANSILISQPYLLSPKENYPAKKFAEFKTSFPSAILEAGL